MSETQIDNILTNIGKVVEEAGTTLSQREV